MPAQWHRGWHDKSSKAFRARNQVSIGLVIASNAATRYVSSYPISCLPSKYPLHGDLYRHINKPRIVKHRLKLVPRLLVQQDVVACRGQGE